MRLKRIRYFSSLEEREFGFLQDKTLRVKRIGQSYVGNMRKNISDRLSKSAYNDLNKASDAVKKARNLEKADTSNNLINNKSVARGLFKNIRDNGGRVFLGDPKEAGFFGFLDKNLLEAKNSLQADLNDGSLSKSDKIGLKKLDNHFKSGKKQFIVASPENSIGTLSHELGHQQRFNSKNPIVRYVTRNQSDIRSRLGKYNYKVDKNNKAIISDSSKYNPFRAMYDHAMVVTDERDATKRGLNNLKKLGVSKDILDKQKQNLSLAGDTYKYSGRSRIKSLLADYVQIPSRRQAQETLKKQEQANKYKGSSSSKPVTIPEIKTAPTIKTPNKPVSTKPITFTKKPLQSTSLITGNVKY